METVLYRANKRRFIFSVFEKLLFVFLLFSLFASSISFVNAATLETSQDFTFSLGLGESSSIDTSHMEFAVTSIKVTTNEKTSGILKVSYVQSRPIDKFLISRLSYQYFRAFSDESIAKGSIYFTVDKSWIQGNSLTEDAVSLYWFDTKDDRWYPVSTQFQYMKGSTYYFTADLDSFGYFVIADKDIAISSALPSDISDSKSTDVDDIKDTVGLQDVQAPELEMPSADPQQASLWLFSLLGLIIIGSLGAGSFVLLKGIQKDSAKSNAKRMKKATDAVSNAIAAAESKAYAEIKIVDDSLKSKIDSLEPKVAEKFVSAMRAKGMDDDAIRTELLQNHISYSVIQKVMG